MMYGKQSIVPDSLFNRIGTEEGRKVNARVGGSEKEI